MSSPDSETFEIPSISTETTPTPPAILEAREAERVSLQAREADRDDERVSELAARLEAAYLGAAAAATSGEASASGSAAASSGVPLAAQAGEWLPRPPRTQEEAHAQHVRLFGPSDTWSHERHAGQILRGPLLLTFHALPCSRCGGHILRPQHAGQLVVASEVLHWRVLRPGGQPEVLCAVCNSVFELWRELRNADLHDGSRAVLWTSVTFIRRVVLEHQWSATEHPEDPDDPIHDGPRPPG